MNFKSVFIMMLFFIWCLLCWNRYVCTIKSLCGKTPSLISSDEPEMDITPIKFKRNSDSAILGSFKSYADSIVKLGDSNRLDIVGEYFRNEINSTSFANLGLARAYQLRGLLAASGMDTTKMAMIGRLVNEDVKDSISVASYIAISPKVDLMSSEVQIITSNGVTEIYFPTNSSKEIKSKVLDSFLNQVANTSKEKSILLRGHTDNTGEESANKALSLQRCQTIESILIKLGSPKERIQCEGLGSSQPKVDNSTSENRALNRRVEIQVK